jgi:hypothetical protein
MPAAITPDRYDADTAAAMTGLAASMACRPTSASAPSKSGPPR